MEVPQLLAAALVALLSLSTVGLVILRSLTFRLHIRKSQGAEGSSLELDVQLDVDEIVRRLPAEFNDTRDEVMAAIRDGLNDPDRNSREWIGKNRRELRGLWLRSLHRRFRLHPARRLGGVQPSGTGTLTTRFIRAQGIPPTEAVGMPIVTTVDEHGSRGELFAPPPRLRGCCDAAGALRT